ncbi:hypothetical protein [Diadegma fenestrale ichnovirus]|nr:hypothetical protein [Diadegma fenestrale ichnovirus]
MMLEFHKPPEGERRLRSLIAGASAKNHKYSSLCADNVKPWRDQSLRPVPHVLVVPQSHVLWRMA